MSNSSDCAEIDDLEVVADGDAELSAIGVVGGRGRDDIRNVGLMNVTSVAEAADEDVSAASTGIAAGQDANGRGPEQGPGGAYHCQPPNPPARGANQDTYDTIVNDGDMSIAATASADDAVAPIAVTSNARGIQGGIEPDVLINAGSLSVDATTTLVISDVDLIDPPGNGIGQIVRRVNANSHSQHGQASGQQTAGIGGGAVATGLDGGEGDDVIENSNTIDATAMASVTIGTIDLGSADSGIDLRTVSSATATGIAGQSGADQITQSGAVTASATASFTSGELTAAISQGIDGVWNTAADSSAHAYGILAGAGDDTVRNQGETSSISNSDATAGTLSLNGRGFSEIVTRATAESSATSIDGGEGNDILINAARDASPEDAATVTSRSSASALSGGLGITGAGVTTVRDSTFEGGSQAISMATGVDGGADDDLIQNAGLIDSHAGANMLSAQGNLTVIGVSATNADGTATAESHGIAGGSGADLVQNSGIVRSDTDVLAQSVDITFSVLGTSISPSSTRVDGTGFGPFIDTRTSGLATTVGIEGGEGGDTIVNFGTDSLIQSRAFADTLAATVTSTFSSVGGNPGRLLANTYSDTATTASAVATGISGDLTLTAAMRPKVSPATVPGADLIRNEGTVDVDAISHALVAETNFGLTGETIPGLGIVIGTLIGKGGGYSSALGIGIDSGGGGDDVINDGLIDVFADANLPSFGLSLRISNGPSVGLSSLIESRSVGIMTGDGDDRAINNGVITSVADSDAFSLGVGVTGRGLVSGVSASINIEGEAVGIDSGTGADLVMGGSDDPASASSITATATALGSNVAGLVNFSEAAPGGDGPSTGIYTAVKIGVDSAATAIGIQSDGATTETTTDLGLFGVPLSGLINYRIEELAEFDSDRIYNFDPITTSATSLGLSLAGGGQGQGLTLVKTFGSANSDATGIAAGGGADIVRNSGVLTDTAVAETRGVAFSYTTSTGAAGAHSGGQDSVASATGIDTDSDVQSRVREFEIATRQTQNLPGENGQSGTIRSSDVFLAADGDDLIVNSGLIDNSANAFTAVGNVAVAGKGQSATSTRSSSAASTIGIDAGGGNNVVRNSGELLNHSEARTESGAISVTLDLGVATAVSKGSEATAEAIGILTNNDDAIVARSFEMEGSANNSVIGGSAEIHSSDVQSATAGDDFVHNDGHIDANATANNIEGEVAIVAVKGLAATVTDARAAANAVGIETGIGDDEVHSDAAIEATSFANADAVAVSVTTTGLAASLNKLLDGGTLSTARATGINLEGISERGTTTDATAIGIHHLAGDPIFEFDSSVRREQYTLEDSGDDLLRNTGNIHATSRAIAASGAVGVSIRGVSGAITTATADGEATAIAAGGGNDEIRNLGQLDALAVGDATTINVTVAPTGIGVAANSVFSGGVTGTADAFGIRADGTAERRDSQELGVSNDGVTLEFSSLKRQSAGDDLVVSIGSDAAVEAEIDVTARSIVPSVAFAYSSAGVGAAISSAESISRSAAIDTGAGNDTIRNSSWLSATSQSNSDVINVSVTGGGIGLAADAVWDGGSTAEARARGIDTDGRILEETRSTSITRTGCEAPSCSGPVYAIEHVTTSLFAAGDDLVVNEGQIDADSLAVSPSVGVSFQLTGGLSAALTAATATADTVAIDLGAGIDTVRNSGELNADALSVAGEVSVAYTSGGVGVATNAAWKGGTQSNASAVGIGTDDRISTTTTTSIDPHADDQFRFREENVEYDAGADLIVNEGAIHADADAVSAAIAVGVTPAGVAAAVATATTNAQAAGISSQRGADTIVNSGEITADAYGDASAVNVAVVPAGVALAGDASWDGGTTGNARAAAIDSGLDSDMVRNSGDLTVNADARSRSLDVPVALYGVGLGVAQSEAFANGFGIYADEGDDVIVNSGTIMETTNANAISLGASVNVFGVAGTGNASWDGGILARSDGAAIDAGDGDDRIHNAGALTANSDSDSVSGMIGFTYGGLAAAVSTSTADSDVDGINLGAGEDVAVNEGSVTANADALAVTVNGTLGVFGIALSGDPVWDGGTTGSASATGIAGGAGDDRVRNEAGVDVDSLARATSVDIALSAIGVVASVSTAQSDARATGLAGDEGNDTLINNGTVDAQSDARATHVAVDVAGLGAAGAVDSVWEGGTSAASDALGLSGGAGVDLMRNEGSVTATALADTDSVGVAATAAGYSQSTVGSTATARSTALDAYIDAQPDDDVIYTDADDDLIVNAGTVVATATADAGSVGVSFTALGAAIADAFVDAATNSEARANGIRGGGGADRIVLEQTSDVSVTSTANLKATQVGIALTAGFSSADVSSHAGAFATGIDAGAGDDQIRLDGLLSTIANSTAASGGWSFTTIGAASPEVDSNNEARATGASGGDGDDLIDNQAAMTVAATATNSGRTTNVVGTGAGFGDAGTLGTAVAIGLRGEAGDDRIFNSARDGTPAESAGIRVTATSNVTARSFGLAILGYSANYASATAHSFATGISGGSGLDRIVNDTELHATASSTTTSIGRTVNIFGVGHTDAGTYAEATATGIDGGADRAIIENFGHISAGATATTNVSGFAFTLGGATAFSEVSSATATTRGMLGWALADDIYNFGSLTASSEFVLNASGSSSAVFGASNSSATLTGTLAATGMAGLGGDDRLFNVGTLTIGTMSSFNANNASWTLGGSAGSSSAGMTGNAWLTGISGGAGHDTIANEGMLGIHATGTGTLNGSSWALAGRSNDQAKLTNRIDATALSGGADADTLLNFGTIDLTIDNALSLNGGARTLFGSANGGADLGLGSHGIGMDGGTGADTIRNQGNLWLDSVADLTTTSLASTFAGDATSTLTTAVTATARGMTGGAGADSILNSGDMDIAASAALDAGGGVATRLGDAETTATTDAYAVAVGIDAGDDDDSVEQNGMLRVWAESNLSGTIDAAGGGLFVDGTSRATINASLNGSGFLLGTGNDVLSNRGESRIGIGGSNAATTTSNGAAGIAGSATANATARTDLAGVTGVDTGDGINVWTNSTTGLLEVNAVPETHASASADGSGLVNGNGIATAESSSNGVLATGVIGGTSADAVYNDGELRVLAQPVASSEGLSDADGIDFFTAARSEANASINADDVKASGISTSAGDNLIENAGVIDVIAAPHAGLALATADWQARNDSSGNPITLAVDAFATSGASANGTTAVGIESGDGGDMIRNLGDLTVAARPAATADAFARGAGWDGDAEAVATALTNHAVAVGIDAGDGDNRVENFGSILVNSEPESIVRASANPGLAQSSEAIETTVVELIPQRFGILRRIVGYITRTVVVTILEPVLDEGESVEDARAEAHSARAIGILTGSGDDRIVNAGTIETGVQSTTSEIRVGAGTVEQTQVRTVGTAIDSGAGDDRVVFRSGAVAVGHVDLGTGDDVLELHGLSIIDGEASGGEGIDRIEFIDSGAFVGTLQEFEQAFKFGPGTYQVDSLPGMDLVQIDQGVLMIDGDYQMLASGEYRTTIFGDGTFGQLASSGTISLDGQLTVGRDEGIFTDGQRFEIVSAASVDGLFSGVMLPEPTALVDFELEQDADSVDVIATVEAFSVVASSQGKVQGGMATYFDAVSTDPASPIRSLVGSMQAIEASYTLGASLAALSPAAYGNFAQSGLASARHGTGSLRDRMAQLRGTSGGSSYQAATAGAILDGQFAESRNGGLGAWAAFSGRSGQQTGDASGYGGFDFDTRWFEAGMDLTTDAGWAFGFRAADSRSNTLLDTEMAYGRTEGRHLAVFATFDLARGYVQAGVDFGNSRTESVRRVEAVGVSETQYADFSNDYSSRFVEFGHQFAFGSMNAEVFGVLNQIELTDGEVSEIGDGAMGFVLKPRKASELNSEIGWRSAWPFEIRSGRLTPTLSLAWTRDLSTSAADIVGYMETLPGTSLRLAGHQRARDGGRIGIGLGYEGRPNRSWSVQYNTERRGDYEDAGLALQYRSRF